MENQKVAITTTIKGCTEEILRSFLRYHFAIGFDHVFLFYDDCNEIVPAFVCKSTQVTVIKNDEHLAKQWQATQNLTMLSYCQSDLIARQILNIEVAIKIADEIGVTWIVHIDVDEVFLPLGFNNVKDHFTHLDHNHISSMNYVNYESILESLDIDNYFNEVTLFKKNLRHLNVRQKSLIQKNYKKGLKDYFLFYGNGKGAGRDSSKLKPDGPHYFTQVVRTASLKFPIILHYPICSLEYFYTKYQILGMFPDKWLGEQNIKEKLPFHIRSRDIVNTKSYEDAKIFYAEEVILKDTALIDFFLEEGIFCRIEGPSKLLTFET